jgi:hypothetical protein
MFLFKNKIFLSIQLVLLIFLVVFNCQTVLAASSVKSQFNTGLYETGHGAGYPEADTGSGLSKSYSEKNLINKISIIVAEVLSFLGVIFMILMLYGGYVWMKARGNEADVKRARDIMIDAVIGLIIVAAAYAISYFVVGYLLSYTTPVTFDS